jgi:hypothetical protein
MDNEQGTRFLRQIMMQRYKLLIQRIKTVYGLNEQEVQRLEERILRIDWLTEKRASDGP